MDRIADVDALRSLQGEWWALWRAAETTPFQSPAWLLPWWDAFAPGELLALAVRDGGRLRALAPFYRDTAGVVRPLGVSLSDYLDVLLDPSCADEASAALGAAMTDHLARDVRRWEMPSLRPAAAAWRLAPSAAVRRTDGSPCPVLVPIDGGTLADAIHPRKRRKLRMAENRAARGGRTVIARASGDAVAPAFDALVRLHAQRWADEGGGVLSDPRTLAFHRAALPALDAADLLDMFACYDDEAIVGVYYGLRDGARAYAYLGGYDTTLASLSPGSRLLGHAIREASQAGAREFHFLRGGEAYKYEWGAVDVMNGRLAFEPRAASADV